MEKKNLKVPKTISKLLNLGATILSHLELPRLESLVLLSYALKKSKEEIYASLNEEVNNSQGELFLSLLERRASGEPSAYIIEEKEFFGLPLEVNSDVLIPRPDTEILVEQAINIINEKLKTKTDGRPLKVADCCFGSGAIIIALAKEFETQAKAGLIEFYASDISEAAFKVASRNLAKHNLQKIVGLFCGDLLTPLKTKAPFCVIVTNPPYLTNSECDKKIASGWREPDLALRGGIDGLDLIKKIINNAIGILENRGYLLIEASSNQMEAISNLLKKSDFQNIKITKDLANLDRVIGGQKWKI